VLAPAGTVLAQNPSTFTLVFRSPSTWIYRLAGAESYFTASDLRCSLTSRSNQSAHVSCPSPAVLIRRETAFPGWSASLDGHATRISRVNGLFQTVAVGAGSHRVQFSYRPPYVQWGYLAFAAGCLSLAVGLTRRRVPLP
jgi:Bacterial membrane protein YfhO